MPCADSLLLHIHQRRSATFLTRTEETNLISVLSLANRPTQKTPAAGCGVRAGGQWRRTGNHAAEPTASRWQSDVMGQAWGSMRVSDRRQTKVV